MPRTHASFHIPHWVNLLSSILYLLLFAFCLSASATSLWNEAENGGRSLYTDRKAFRVGDLVTIIVNQTTTATKDQRTATDKTVDETARFEALFGPFMGGVRTAAELTRREPHNRWAGARTFNGGGTVNNTETLTSTIQAEVTDVMPNKVMRIMASRRVEAGQEKSDLVLTGLVRYEDLTAANTVLSTQVANLQVKQISNGAVSREQRKGWLTRIWETIAPF